MPCSTMQRNSVTHLFQIIFEWKYSSWFASEIIVILFNESVGNNANDICFVECIHHDDRDSSSVVKSIGTIVSLFLTHSPVQFVSCDEKKIERQ